MSVKQRRILTKKILLWIFGILVVLALIATLIGPKIILTTGVHGIEGYIGSVMPDVFFGEIYPGLNTDNTGVLVVANTNILRASTTAAPGTRPKPGKLSATTRSSPTIRSLSMPLPGIPRTISTGLPRAFTPKNPFLHLL